MRQRSRILSPDLYVDEELADKLPIEKRFFFQGLFTIADRDGRLEDRPRQIKLFTVPYDDVNVDEWLDSCATAGVLQRYEVDGKRYIQINKTAWGKHQTIHNKEKSSTIPGNSGELRGTPGNSGTLQVPSSNSYSSCSSSTSTSCSSSEEALVSKETKIKNVDNSESVAAQVAESRTSAKSKLNLTPLRQSFEDWRSTDIAWLDQLRMSEVLSSQIKSIDNAYSLTEFVKSYSGDLSYDVYNRPDKFSDVPDEQGWRNLLKGYIRTGIKDGKMGDYGMKGKMSLADERAHEAKKRRSPEEV